MPRAAPAGPERDWREAARNQSSLDDPDLPSRAPVLGISPEDETSHEGQRQNRNRILGQVRIGALPPASIPGLLGRQQVGAKIATAPGRGEPHPLGSLLHKPVMRDLIVVALIVARKIPDLRLVLNALLRRHQLPAARISLVGAPRPKGVGRARHAEKQDESSNARRAVQHVVILFSRENAAKQAPLRGVWRNGDRSFAQTPNSKEFGTPAVQADRDWLRFSAEPSPLPHHAQARSDPTRAP